MHLNRRIVLQLVIFAVIAAAAGLTMTVDYIGAPAMFFGIGRYTVTVDLPRAAGLYPNANVSYRGTEVGQVEKVELTESGVRARLSMRSDIKIPSDLRAEVHSQNALGEQFVSLLPRNDASPPLKNGDVIPLSSTSVPPDVDQLLDATNRGLEAIPRGNLKAVIDESYTAIGGLGPELERLVAGSTQLAIDADKNVDPLTALIDRSPPVLKSQVDSADAIQAWAAHLAAITGQLRTSDTSVAGVLRNGGPAADQARQLFQRLQPAVPLLLANLVTLGDVAVTYQPALEQLLVLFPQAVANVQGMMIANRDTKQDYKGLYLDFKLNLNIPPVCNTGFLPPQQQRVPTFEDHPNRPPGDLYCRVPQDSPFNVRGARNFPCMTVPGKRAPTVMLCESDQQYVPLNDGYNWKGDPNATLSGQGVPDIPPEPPSTRTPPPPGNSAPPIAAAEYDPATGAYIGPDGRLYTQSDLSQTAPKERTWQSMLIPPTKN